MIDPYNYLKNRYKEKISFKSRQLISTFSSAIIFLYIYFLIFYLIFYSFLFHFSSLYFSFLSFFLVLIVFISRVISPSYWERCQNSLRKLAINIDKPDHIKRTAIIEVITDLNKFIPKKYTGFSYRVIKGLNDYFSYILLPLISSKNKGLLKEIKKGLINISEVGDNHSMLEEILKLHSQILRYKEFSNLSIVYPYLRKKNVISNPYDLIDEIELKKEKIISPFKRIFYFLEEYNVIKTIITTVLITIIAIILRYFELTDKILDLIK